MTTIQQTVAAPSLPDHIFCISSALILLFPQKLDMSLGDSVLNMSASPRDWTGLDNKNLGLTIALHLDVY